MNEGAAQDKDQDVCDWLANLPAGTMLEVQRRHVAEAGTYITYVIDEAQKQVIVVAIREAVSPSEVTGGGET